MSRPWLAVVCPTCAAGEGALCHVAGLGAVAFAHPDRLTAWTTLAIQRAAGTMAAPYNAGGRGPAMPVERTGGAA